MDLRALESLRFPVFSLMIREFDAESSSHQTASSTIQPFGLQTSRRIDRKSRVCARFAIERGPGERSRRPDSAESSKTYPSAIQPRSADYCLRFACWPGHQDGSDDLASSFIKRRYRRCRKCFSERYGSATPARKAKVKKNSLIATRSAGLGSKGLDPFPF